MRRSAPVTWDQVRVGLFLVAALVLLAVGVFLVGDTGHVFGERYRLVTLLRSSAGLVEGAPVQVAGRSAGQVERIEFIEPERRPPSGQAVAVWLAVDREVRELVRADSRARLRTQGLLGDRLVDIEPGSRGARPLGPGDTLEAVEALDYQAALDQASEAVTALTELVRHLTELTGDVLAGEGSLGRLVTDDRLYDRLASLAGTLDELLGRAADGEGSLGRLLTDEELYERFASAAASLDSVTAAVASGRGTLGRLAVSDSLYRSLADVTARTDSLIAALAAGRGTLGRLLTEDEAYEEVLKTLVELNAILEDLRAEPARYIPPVEIF